MRVKRRGSERDHGLVSTELNLRSMSWNIQEAKVEATAWFVPDFNTPARHDWFVSVSPSEIAAMLDALAASLGGPERERVAAAFAPCISSLLRIASESALLLQPREQASTQSNAVAPQSNA